MDKRKLMTDQSFIRKSRSLLASNGHDESIDGTFINQRGLISRSANSEKPFGTGCEKGVRVCLRVVSAYRGGGVRGQRSRSEGGNERASGRE